ncbi:contactin-2-like [Mobula hypostoma]|uniref:contactin-2-like n=1 Tax=Mobula hypostoma TaxID=723540 RepID=UPI002FC34A38
MEGATTQDRKKLQSRKLIMGTSPLQLRGRLQKSHKPRRLRDFEQSIMSTSLPQAADKPVPNGSSEIFISTESMGLPPHEVPGVNIQVVALRKEEQKGGVPPISVTKGHPFNNTTLDSGQALHWECRVNERPRPIYRWLKNGENFLSQGSFEDPDLELHADFGSLREWDHSQGFTTGCYSICQENSSPSKFQDLMALEAGEPKVGVPAGNRCVVGDRRSPAVCPESRDLWAQSSEKVTQQTF